MDNQLYQAIETALQRTDTHTNAAEAHGIMCGFLCSNTTQDNSIWVKQVLGELDTGDVLGQQTQNLLLKLQDYFRDQLNSPEFAFEPLLPPDNEALNQRLQALADWSDGFTLGVTAGGMNEKRSQHLARESQEFMGDILKFSQLDPAMEDNDENENAYMELVEYIRVGVVTLYEDCHPALPSSSNNLM